MTSHHTILRSAVAITLLLCLSCITAHGATSKDPPKSSRINLKSAPASDTPSVPRKIQPEFQNEFARQLVQAGDKAEGWALFSDSGMGHNGQRWIIQTNDPKNNSASLCVIKQGETACQSSKISPKQFAKITPTLKKADTLDHILPNVFDGISFEYLHATNSVPVVKRVVFMTSSKPLPEAYENLVRAFNK
jgi:hypothetical protein